MNYEGIKTIEDRTKVAIACNSARTQAISLYRYISRLIDDEYCTIGVNEQYEALSDEMCSIYEMSLRLVIELDCLCGCKTHRAAAWHDRCTRLIELSHDD